MKMLLSSVKDLICSCDGVVYSGLVCDFCNASAKRRAARVALSCGSVLGAEEFYGKNLTDFTTLSALDFGRYTSWHL